MHFCPECGNNLEGIFRKEVQNCILKSNTDYRMIL
jgi:hypothetical protein